MPSVTIPRADIPMVELDDKERLIASRDLYRWMSDITARVGGTTGAISDSSETFDDAGIEETKASVYHLEDAVSQTPVVQELFHLVEVQSDQIAELAAMVAEMAKIINGVNQGTLQ